jgi:hypothetical protein
MKQSYIFLTVLVIASLIAGFGIVSATKRIIAYNTPPVESPVTENERAAFTAGIVMGLDIALAVKGEASLSKETWEKMAIGFDGVTEGCPDMECVIKRVVTLREVIRQKAAKFIGPEVLR